MKTETIAKANELIKEIKEWKQMLPENQVQREDYDVLEKRMPDIASVGTREFWIGNKYRVNDIRYSADSKVYGDVVIEALERIYSRIKKKIAALEKELAELKDE